ncbi:MAG TPA: TolC family protein [Anaerovoracaceae bacterium]|nr:TolC family protein [Anaerovoracaceae bacterium]
MHFKKFSIVCLVLIFALSSISLSFAEASAEAAEAKEENAEEPAAAEKKAAETIASLEFFGPAIDLTLDQALKAALTSGAAIKAAEIQKQSDAANAKANAESLSDMNKTNKDPNSDNTYSRSELDKTRKAQEYYTSIADRNYAAAKNTITYNINNAYYSLLNAEEGVRIARENAALQKDLLSLVNQKLSMGVASKQDVLESEISLNSAESTLSSAEVFLAEKKISFNIELGYDEMQDVNPTSKLEMVKMPDLTVEEAITDAIANRNELYTCAFDIYSAEKELNNYVAYPRSSAKYLTAYKNYNSAQNSYNAKEASLKQEVRVNYANMLSAGTTAENSKLSVDKAKESHKIYLEKYKLGMATLDEVQKAQISLYEAEKSYAESVLAFNLAAITYEMSATVGMGSY